MALPSAVQILQGYRVRGGVEKLQFLHSFQASRYATNRLTLIQYRAAMVLQPAPTSLSDVLASNRSQGSTIQIICNTLPHQIVCSQRSSVRREDSRFYNIAHFGVLAATH
jgi:hypothetical protein